MLIFTFTLTDCLNEMGQVKAPWLYQTERDLILELRMKISNLHWSMGTLTIENRYLKKLVHTTKPDHWTTWIELLDYVKKLEGKIEAKNKRIRILEKQLGIRQWQMPAPYRKI